ncbi:MAG: ABC-type transport auxiliary lipoprotein family protein [Glaciecola sp.]|jgi:uncharacterized lipoprotein YmbA
MLNFTLYKLLLLMSITTGLSACGTTVQAPDTTYYLFDANPVAQLNKEAKTSVMLDIVSLPDYLKTNQLVMKEGDNQLIKANYHSWADGLGEAMQRALLNDLNASMAETEWLDFCRKCTKVKVTIEHFYPDRNGEVLLSGSFRISKRNEHTATRVFRFHYTDILEKGGYAGAVKKMRALSKKLSHEISNVIVE